MRFALSLLLLFSAARLAAADLTAVRVWPGYRTAESFERISEFFDGKENTSGQTHIRSQPATREGFYFLTRIKNPGTPLADVRVELSVITSASADPKTFTAFPATTVPSGSHVFQIGLTGADWSDATANPVAWQLRLLTAEGQELLRTQSFLWSQPAKN
ncbi:hypothetical protein CMV30_04425 [Nibricoccus aquaticus]|uniref:Uncharacterized protein n=1 Tax=Nibricoccus aquaticus TaxID=2576891 RepID=A0A290Q3L8_9BACT|nr:hypothetical protein [Nibricoccus aquaticus]ATC63259.1 hypothetical protein CMV30_04425 [Nibricoccus aquaticus]